MDTRRLQYFVAVAEHLNFSAAARQLGMAQPPLSIQIKKLEAEIGGPLFQRGKRIRLTPLGLYLLDEARPLLLSAASLEDRVRDAAAGRAGEIRICYLELALSERTTKRLRKFLRKNRGVRLSINQKRSRATLASGEWDILIADSLETPEGATKIESTTVGFVIPPKHRLVEREEITVTDLVGETLLVGDHDERTCYEDFVLKLAQAEGVSANLPHSRSTRLERMLAVSLGAGIAPCSSSERILLDGIWKPLAGSPTACTVATANPDSRATALPTLLEALQG